MSNIYPDMRVLQKDYDRIKANSAKANPVRAAEMMASKIEDKNKIIRRLRAAVMMYGYLMTRTAEGLGVVRAFSKRAKELGYTDTQIKEYGFMGFKPWDYGFKDFQDHFDADGNVILTAPQE